MLRDTADFGDFCRIWTVSEEGIDPQWKGRVHIYDQFVIVRNHKNYRFVPLQNFKGGLRGMPLEVNEDAFVVDDGVESLQGGLTAPLSRHRSILFVLRPFGDTFEILISEMPNPNTTGEDDVRARVHGGPHGVDS